MYYFAIAAFNAPKPAFCRIFQIYFYNQYLYLIKLITEYLENSAQIKGRVLLSAPQNVIHLNRNYTNRFMQTY